MYTMQGRKPFCSEWVFFFSSLDNTEQSSKCLNKQAGQDTHPHLLEFFFYLKQTRIKNQALMLDPKCHMLGAVGKQPAPAHSLWCAPLFPLQTAIPVGTRQGRFSCEVHCIFVWFVFLGSRAAQCAVVWCCWSLPARGNGSE